MNDGAVNPTPLVHSLGLGQLNCRRLWSRDGSIHDGFMGLVSCLDQLGLQVLCVQETQSPHMSSLPVDQPFRYDGPVGSHGREAGFLFHSSIMATPIPGTPDSQSLRWRLISGSLCVCSFYAPHVGILSDTRIRIWRTLAASVHRVSQLHSGASLLLAGDSNIWCPFFSFLGFSEPPLSSHPPLWCCFGHHSLFHPRHCPLGFELLSPCASLLSPALF